MSKKAVILLSGGLDSTTLLYHITSEGFTAYPLVISYGQKHKKEVLVAKKISELLGLEIKQIDLNPDIFGVNALTGSKDIPLEGYNAINIALTVVPNRNMVFLSLAASYAVSIGAEMICYAAHGGDHALYKDCTVEFVSLMGEAIRYTNGVELYAPFIKLTKIDIVKIGRGLGVPFELTWSCYQGGDEPCGVCATCREREDALHTEKQGNNETL